MLVIGCVALRCHVEILCYTALEALVNDSQLNLIFYVTHPLPIYHSLCQSGPNQAPSHSWIVELWHFEMSIAGPAPPRKCCAQYPHTEQSQAHHIDSLPIS